MIEVFDSLRLPKYMFSKRRENFSYAALSMGSQIECSETPLIRFPTAHARLITGWAKFHDW